MFKDRLVWKNEKLIKWNKAQVHLMSHSFCRGSAIFEVISCFKTDRGTMIYRLPDHMNRLFNSARMVNMKLPLTKKKLQEAIKKTVARNKVGWGVIKVVCYYASIEFESVPHDTTVSVSIVALDLNRDLSISKMGEDALATTAVSKWRKYHPDTVPVAAKVAANYLGPMLAKMDVMSRGYKTPLLLDTKGYLAEGATEAFFFVRNKKIYTSTLDNVLPSITRASVIDVAKYLKIPLVEKNIRPSELMKADEAFFASTTVKVWPVKKLEKRNLPAPGPVSLRLAQVFDEICAGRNPKFNKWLMPVRKAR